SQALECLRVLPFEDLGFAKIDHHRTLRRGFPEVIMCEGKAPEQIVKIASGIMEQGVNLLATRCSGDLFSAVAPDLPEAVYHDEGALFAVEQVKVEREGDVTVVSGGTADRPVAEEAALTAHYLGCVVKRLYDVGVAGIHRLLSCWEQIRRADVIVVVAGMEGALASVVAGIADAPLIAVPTSVGYGASFGGLSALLTMLNSCAGGVTVVNIDNGFGAGYAAAVICRRIYGAGGSSRVAEVSGGSRKAPAAVKKAKKAGRRKRT
ncbi:MAG: nickel pincer cofactor biosynthesis protein LarB, partial [Candidatus Krumholzibacteria bacterium]|nr:nickel pincer cofactor biosynthesis protein LarB [Candidatus Krumholzibacteria bacterium]